MRTGSSRFAASVIVALGASLAVPVDLAAQAAVGVDAEPVDCIPIGGNAVAWAQVENNIADTSVHLNFRRMNDAVEDLYYVSMHPAGQGRYWGVFPKAEDREPDRHDLAETREAVQAEHSWAAWWREKDASDDRNPSSDLDDDLIRERASIGKQIPRDWLAEMDDAAFQSWLEQLENEPSEYYTSIHDAQGREIARSKTRVAEVRSGCRVDMTPQQAGEAENLTVGETAHWQRGEEVFHWLCDGVVSRIDPTAILRGDEICRGVCVVAWYKKSAFLIPAAVVVGGTGVVILTDDDPPRQSPTF